MDEIKVKEYSKVNVGPWQNARGLDHRKEIMGAEQTKKVSEEDALKEAEETLKKIAEQKEDSAKGEVSEEKKKTKVKVGKAKVRSRKYQKAISLIDREKLYSLDEAIQLAKDSSYTKFPGSLEVHIRLEAKKGKKLEPVRGLINLPHGTGKKVKVGLLDEAMADKILKEKRSEFDVLITTPELMPKIAKVARILGPIGKMPNPKSGTITNDPEKTIEEIQKGKVEYKSDDGGNVHVGIGKINWEDKLLKENFKSVILALGSQKLKSITISATMGPGIKIAL